MAVVIFFDSSGLLSEDAEIVVDDAAQLFAGLAATVACLWMSRRVHGVERRWRQFMGFGMAGWSVGQALWSYYQIFSDTPLPSPSWADVGYLTMPIGALPALLALAVEPRPRHQNPESMTRQASVVFFLDGLIIVGSLFILTWSTALGAVVDAGAPGRPAFGVAIAYPITDLMLVSIVVLFAVTRRVPLQYRMQLWLLGFGLVAISLSDSIFAYLVSSGADVMPPATNFGFIAGPLLVGVAALATADGSSQAGHPRAHRIVERIHLLLPYILVAACGALVAAQMTLGQDIDTTEASVAWVVLGLVLVRQIITLLENTALLERVSATQAELAHRAQHDPLTGLPNRALFSERLHDAMTRHRDHGRPFALLLVDLDDFKAINDSFGHAAGDRLLSSVGERLRSCVRGGDTVARLGGDEFAVVLDGAADRPGSVGERILDALRHPFEIDGQMLALGASVGVVEPGPDDVGVTADLLLQRADGAMYVGKRRGKGMAVHYRPDLLHELPTRIPQGQ
ncbi:MAG TPA: GGDEF domain-containing protein [Acidimicrobiales bacterium]|nr:GGDEF domain-containing protein [Acidimicrobiales bacterium]